MAKQVVTSLASSTPIPGSGNAFFVTWTFNTNTELTGFDINFSYESDALTLEQSTCEVLWVGYSSEEACQLFQPSDSPGYVPASALVVLEGGEGPRYGDTDEYVLCSPTQQFDLPTCPAQDINGCLNPELDVLISFTEKTFQFPLNDCEELGGMLNSSPIVCAQGKLMDVFDFIVFCPEEGELVVWGSGVDDTPTLLYSSAAAEFESASAEGGDDLCEDVDCNDPIFQANSCAPVGGTDLCGTTLATIASTCCSMDVGCDCDFPDCMGTSSCCADACALCNADINFMCAAEVKSDPHFHGFLGQHFDFTGVPGEFYTLIMDQLLVINAQFATGYRTGHYFNASSMQTMPMRPYGTWMSQLSLRLVHDDNSTLVTISTQESSDIHSALCGKLCFFGGTVVIDGAAATTTGLVHVAEQTTVELLNRQSFGRVKVKSPLFVGSVDYVAAPQSWEVPVARREEYAHLNLKVESVLLSPDAKGVLAESATQRRDSSGSAIVEGMSKNGLGVLSGATRDYQVAHLAATSLLIDQKP